MKYKIMSTSEIDEELELQLGDIIEINAPDNVDINGMTFFVEYIDKTLIKLLNIENNKKLSIPIEKGSLLDPSIQQISLLDRADSPSFVKQNNLYPGTWINIKFDSVDDTFDIDGLIINVDEDQIELKTYPDNETIYIDFGYKGIPEDLPIEKITIIPNPTLPSTDLLTEQQDLSEELTEDLELPIESINQSPEELEQIKELNKNEELYPYLVTLIEKLESVKKEIPKYENFSKEDILKWKAEGVGNRSIEEFIAVVNN